VGKGQKNSKTKDEIETSFLALLEPQVVKFHGIFSDEKVSIELETERNWRHKCF
jgi:hypothetical protein